MEQLLKKAREGVKASQSALIDMVFDTGNFDYRFSFLEPNDVQWLRPWAIDERNIKACVLLMTGMENRFRGWNEDFEDEDTGEQVTAHRVESLEGSLFPKNNTESLRLLTIICEDWQLNERSELYMAWNTIRNKTQQNYSKLLHHLADEGNDKDAQKELAEAYRYGNERNGIYINRLLAKKYYDMIGEAYDSKEDDTKDDPVEETYTLKGNAETLKGICDTINELCGRFGTPDNELGLFVPLQPLMKLLVGSDDAAYRGNILSMEQPDNNTLVLHTESNSTSPLFYALQQAFSNISVRED